MLCGEPASRRRARITPPSSGRPKGFAFRPPLMSNVRAISMKRTDAQEEQEGFVRGYHDIPSDNKLCQMSFVELAAELASSEKDSPKFIAIERELKKHIAKDQAKINLPNMLYAACVGGTFALAGVVLGYYLKNDVSPSSTVNEVEKSALAPSLQSGNVSVSQPPIVTPSPHPAPTQNNAQHSNKYP